MNVNSIHSYFSGTNLNWMEERLSPGSQGVEFQVSDYRSISTQDPGPYQWGLVDENLWKRGNKFNKSDLELVGV